ncbi:MAG TPA: hypothetical protein VGR06_28385 [Actinophytocola sp.]|uniref:hypothetical protein n=1 Tax=Actinophytocola sp. TaxID=1872138 RepID=UPI002E076326|nr:hypothetical protein [Actinophytocola sp.]
MSGYRADPAALGAASRVLTGAADTMSTALDRLDPGVCAAIGPVRLGRVAAGVTDSVRGDLDRTAGAVGHAAELLDSAARGYAEHDQAAADELRGRAGE